MTKKVVLHIGAPKSGTSFVQSVLEHNRDLLHDRGVHWPAGRWGIQVRAVEDLRDAARGERADAPRWDDLVTAINEFDGDVAIISMEWLCLGDEDLARRAVDSLRGYDVHVVITVRDLARVIPAQWQESTQNGFGWTYSDFVRGVTARKPQKTRTGAHFWLNQDWGRMLRVWGAQVGSGQLWLVTVPPATAGPDVLWERFCEVADIDPRGFSLNGWPNESLGAASAELMRRIQLARREEGPSPRHRANLKHRLAKSTLAAHRRQEPRLILPPDKYEWAQKATQEQLKQIRAAKPQIVGDLADLWPRYEPLEPGATADPSTISDTDLLAVAMQGLIGLTRPKGANPSP